MIELQWYPRYEPLRMTLEPERHVVTRAEIGKAAFCHCSCGHVFEAFDGGGDACARQDAFDDCAADVLRAIAQRDERLIRLDRQRTLALELIAHLSANAR